MTNIVSFPGLGLEFELDRVAFTLLGRNIYWYGIIIACGFLLAVAYAMWKAPKYRIDPDKIIDMLFFAVPLCIIGARAYYVIFNPSICFDPEGSFSFYRMIALWDGGLAIYGAVIVAIVVVLVYCKIRRQSFWDYADLCILGVMIGQSIGRWGNFVNVEAYGSVTAAPWRMCSKSIANYLWNHGYIVTEGEYQTILDGYQGVHPTFFYESMWNLLGFIILALLARKGRKVKGQTFAGYLIWYGLGRTVIEGLRTDSLYFFSTGIRTSQMVGIISVIAGVVLLVVRMKQEKSALTEAVPVTTEGTTQPVEAVEEIAVDEAVGGKVTAEKETIKIEAKEEENSDGSDPD